MRRVVSRGSSGLMRLGLANGKEHGGDDLDEERIGLEAIFSKMGGFAWFISWG